MDKQDVQTGARYLLNGDLVEVIDRDHGRIFMRGVNHKSPIYLPESEVDPLLRQGRLVPVSSALLDEKKALEMVRQDASKRVRFDRATYYVQQLLEMFHGALPREKTIAAVEKMAVELGDPKPPKYTKLYQLKKRFLDNGQNIFALMDASTGKQPRTKRLSQESLDVMQDYIRHHYLKSTKPPGLMVYKLFEAHIEELNRQSDIKLDIPSPSTFYRALKVLPSYTVDVARLGRKAAEKKHGFGQGIHCPDRLLARVEADTQEVDVQLVGDDGLYIGRAYLTVLLEVLTSAVIGWSLSFTPPCFEKTASALRHALSERQDGSPAGLMEELVVDNGAEFYNASLLTIANRLGFTVRFCSKGQPNQKPHIESFFRTLNLQLIHGLDGTTKSNPMMRGDYDSEGEAVMTLEELRNIVTDWIQNYYNKTAHGHRRLPANVLWERNLDKMNPPKVFTAEAVRFICMATHFGTINRGRVRFKNLSWSGPGLSHVQSKLKPGQKAEVLYDRTNLGTVYVREPSSGVFYQANSVHEYQYGLSLYEHELVQQKLKDEAKLFTGEEARKTLRRVWQALSESKTNNARRKRARLRDPRNNEDHFNTPLGEIGVDTQYIDENIQLSEEIDFELIDDMPDDDADDYETFQLPRKQ
ncbi:DDE-type integrase/transposase/recombinase [Pseudomonas yamanorum]|uniref:DDE-type integrase/transposase/recombinase n=1 Tax=Pseudomonas yamanorum TaxID=515393 RepID=UPI001C47F294|nr:DDE-type integrase/transposase/recombinase [Pseudomonas yamanorum]MBV6660833.1 DDE-type integrase/transposase/recombinase [Pseudomonas yamanorum]